MAHFDIDARPALTDDVRELAADVGEELTNQAPHTTMVGRFRADSAVSAGQQAEVAVDTRALHFFDPDTGAGIYDTDSRGELTHDHEMHEHHIIAPATFVSLVIALAVFFAFQRYFVQGLLAGSVK